MLPYLIYSLLGGHVYIFLLGMVSNRSALNLSVDSDVVWVCDRVSKHLHSHHHNCRLQDWYLEIPQYSLIYVSCKLMFSKRLHTLWGWILVSSDVSDKLAVHGSPCWWNSNEVDLWFGFVLFGIYFKSVYFLHGCVGVWPSIPTLIYLGAAVMVCTTKCKCWKKGHRTSVGSVVEWHSVLKSCCQMIDNRMLFWWLRLTHWYISNVWYECLVFANCIICMSSCTKCNVFVLAQHHFKLLFSDMSWIIPSSFVILSLWCSGEYPPQSLLASVWNMEYPLIDLSFTWYTYSSHINVAVSIWFYLPLKFFHQLLFFCSVTPVCWHYDESFRIQCLSLI